MKTNVELEGTVRRLLTELVLHPKDLEVKCEVMTRSAKVLLRAHRADTSRLIGTGGVNFKAIKTIVSIVGHHLGLQVLVPPIMEPITGEADRHKFRPDKNWPKDRICKLIESTARACVSHPDSVRLEESDCGDQSTMIEVTVSRSERQELVFRLREAFETIFDAVGKRNGRIIMVALMTDQDPGQPDTAAGRNVGEIQR